MAKYTIARILKEMQVEGKYGPQIRTAFTTNENGEEVLSAFSKYPLKAGQAIEGEVTVTEKDGRTFHNFAFAKKDAGAGNSAEVMIELKKIYTEVYATRQEVVMTRQLLQKYGVIPAADPTYATKPAQNAFEEDEFDPSEIPFD